MAELYMLSDCRQWELSESLDEWQVQEWRSLGWETILVHFAEQLHSLKSGGARKPTPGSNRLVMHCCFHWERTASMALYPNGGFKCYGCGCSGGIPEFVMALTGICEFEDLAEYFNRLKGLNPGQTRLFAS